MTVPFFGINLERSAERWKRIEASAQACGIEIIRVEGVDGRAVPASDWIDVNVAKFGLRHGRTILPGEYGCYRSHLRALRAVYDSGVPYAVIVEDDVQFEPSTGPLVQSIIDTDLNFDVIKLINHRTTGFVSWTRSKLGVEIGRTMHGPQGSAAAYLVSREGARKLYMRLAVMDLPWDIALERYWDNGIEFYSVLEGIVKFSPNSSASEISSRDSYRATKFPFWKRTPTAVFRGRDYLYRALYAHKR
ncbi:glycosyltransferase family 25 protein [Aquamicrobium sp. LC103]|uniref:glycosyltransferase family 25 protein n=1 Tax=Aquamicrobium sp. LC103 TaxID=1120658 RepID=UPI00063E8235|nr:glycosyltransferase family 25 protein [Aquamicrobium sp. LC103]TKT83007.1 glycosyltransferase family 25 protein [Aquamicrobium sp. LC103]